MVAKIKILKNQSFGQRLNSFKEIKQLITSSFFLIPISLQPNERRKTLIFQTILLLTELINSMKYQRYKHEEIGNHKQREVNELDMISSTTFLVAHHSRETIQLF